MIFEIQLESNWRNPPPQHPTSGRRGGVIVIRLDKLELIIYEKAYMYMYNIFYNIYIWVHEILSKSTFIFNTRVFPYHLPWGYQIAQP